MASHAFEITPDLRADMIAGVSVSDLCSKYGLSDRSLCRRFARARKEGWYRGIAGTPQPPQCRSDDSVAASAKGGSESIPLDVPGIEVDETKDTLKIHARGVPFHTDIELLDYLGMDKDKWECSKFHFGLWQGAQAPRPVGSTSEGWRIEEASPVFVKLYSVWGEFKRNVITETLAEIWKRYSDRYKDHKAVYPVHLRDTMPKSGLALELVLPDVHLGKLAWHLETRWGNYDTAIAMERYRFCVDDLLNQTAHLHFDEIVYVVGNDLLNADNAEGTTQKGTPQSNDGRIQKVFDVATELSIETIDKLITFAPVKVIVMPGNHDRLSAHYLGKLLEHHYRLCDDVEFNTEPSYTKLWKWGSVGIMFAHGDATKLKDAPLDMAVEYRSLWSEMQHCEIHTGDKHQFKALENKGVVARILSSLSSADTWHTQQRYTGNILAGQSFIWHRETGFRGMMQSSVRVNKDGRPIHAG